MHIYYNFSHLRIFLIIFEFENAACKKWRENLNSFFFYFLTQVTILRLRKFELQIYIRNIIFNITLFFSYISYISWFLSWKQIWRTRLYLRIDRGYRFLLWHRLSVIISYQMSYQSVQSATWQRANVCSWNMTLICQNYEYIWVDARPKAKMARIQWSLAKAPSVLR